MFDLSTIQFDDRGLVPVITQDAETGAVLMQAYMNREALEKTLKTREMVYYSRSRQKLWHKGETSGNIQRLKALYADCDQDCLLAKVEQVGSGACHTGAYSCFYQVIVEGEE